MSRAPHAPFDAAAWSVALAKFGAVTHLSVALFDADGNLVSGPAPATPLHTLFQEHGYDPGLFAECARECLAQSIAHRPAVIVAPASGLAVVGTSLMIDGEIVGAAVAGYAVVDFSTAIGIARLAREGGVPFQPLWQVARSQQPIPARRLALHGELLQVLGDTLLRETNRTRRYEESAADLRAALAAKDEFLAVLSHELRSPLTPILGWAHVLKSERGADNVARAAEVIERNALLQLRLVDDLLELTRTTRGAAVMNRAAVRLDEVLAGALDAIAEGAAAAKVTVRLLPTGQPLHVDADWDRLQQVFRNVLSNAVKFTPQGGRVQISIDRDGDRAVVRVRDTGEGIERAFLPFVFDMFRQQEQGTRRAHGGLGIGLALVKALIEAHGGTVTVDSEGHGLGTEVTLMLPLLSSEREDQALAPRVTDSRCDLHGVRALVVDDMEDMRDFMRITLERFGVEVFSAIDGVDALRAMSHDRVQIVLCDLRMPGMDGFEFLRELDRRDGPGHPPVIAVSALAGSADHMRTAAAGFDGHLDKPFDDADLVTMVGTVLARHV